jgi:hypothetical protein
MRNMEAREFEREMEVIGTSIRRVNQLAADAERLTKPRRNKAARPL